MSRYVTPPAETTEADTDDLWDSISGRGDPQQRFRIYRLCECEVCKGTGRVVYDIGRGPAIKGIRCAECRGEGRVRELVATADSPAGVGEALVTLGREGEFEDCPVGILDTEGETGQKWLVRPWLPSARNVSDAARTLATSRTTKGER